MDDTPSPGRDPLPADSAQRPGVAGARLPAGPPPPAPAPLLGRERELAALAAAVDHAGLVTLTGPAGVGKTRLAAEAVHAPFPGGVTFCAVTPAGPDALGQAVAVAARVTERPGQPLEQALAERFRRDRCLLVLDGCDRAREPVATLAGRLLRACPELTVLVTAREPVGAPGERVLPVAPLSPPSASTTAETTARTTAEGAAEADAEAAAVTLFRHVAADVAPEVAPEVAEAACRLLGGLPLAIELVAAQAARIRPDALLAGLAAHLDGPAPDGPAPDGPARDGAAPDGAAEPAGRAPERALRGALDFCFTLLDPDERRTLDRLAVFVGGFDAYAAAHLGAAADPAAAGRVAGRLAGARLLIADPLGDRWRMPEAVRAHAAARLAASGEEPACRAARLDWAVATAAELEREVGAGASVRDRFAAVADDLRAVLDGWTAGAPNARPDPAPGPYRLAVALARLCYAGRFLEEARRRYRQAADLAPGGCRGAARRRYRQAADLAPGGAAAAADLLAAADVAMAEHRGDLAFPLLEESARRAAAAGDRAGQAIALAFASCVGNRFPATFPDPVPHDRLTRLLEQARRVAPPDHPLVAAHIAAAAAWNATGHKTTPDRELAEHALALARAAGDPALISGALDALTSADGAVGRYDLAHRHSHERVELFARLPRHDPRLGVEIIDTLHVVPLVAVAAGELRRALEAAERAWNDPYGGLYMRASKRVVPLALSGEFDEALRHATIMWEAWAEVGRPAARWMAPPAHGAALAYGLRGEAAGHREWRARAERLAAPRGPGDIASSFAAFADPRVALHTGALGEALAGCVDLAGEPPWPAAPHQFFDAYAWSVAAETAVVAGLPDAAERLERAAPAGAVCRWAAACLARARGRLHGDPAALALALAGWEAIGARFERACTLALIPDRAAQAAAEFATLRCPPPAHP